MNDLLAVVTEMRESTDAVQWKLHEWADRIEALAPGAGLSAEEVAALEWVQKRRNVKYLRMSEWRYNAFILAATVRRLASAPAGEVSKAAPLPNARDVREAISGALISSEKAVKVLSNMLKDTKMLQGFAVADEILGDIRQAQKLLAVHPNEAPATTPPAPSPVGDSFGSYEVHFPGHDDEHDDTPFVLASDYEKLLQAYERLTPTTQQTGAVAWLYELVGKSGEIANSDASVRRQNFPFGRPDINYNGEATVRETPLYTAPGARVDDAARALVNAVDTNHDNRESPMRYTVPWKEVTDLRAALDWHRPTKAEQAQIDRAVHGEHSAALAHKAGE